MNGPGEGELLPGDDRTFLVKVARPELSLIEYDTGPGYTGATPHFHERHTDAFYILAGELEFTLGRETVRGGAGTAVTVPPGVVHAFTGTGGRARFLNVHAPDAGFADYIRAAVRDEPATFDSVGVDEPQEPGGGTVLRPGEGTAFEVGTATSLFKATRVTTAGFFSLAEVTIQPGTSGPPPHSHRELLDSFYVLEGTLTVRVGDGEVEAPPGTYACVPPGIVHTFANRSDGPVRFLNLNTPGGWEDYIRDLAAATPADGPPDPQLMGEILARHDLLLLS
ncbi:MAG TPA: cupin domain-containing protein [Gaiellaceae bacterium]|nr:cupin domain-containing protein [Gaiellaceae bacterium]